LGDCLVEWADCGVYCGRRSHKEEVASLKARIVELNQAAKGASMGARSGQKEADGLRKELEKVRKRASDAEGKLRAAIQVRCPWPPSPLYPLSPVEKET
jgi:hypothetical protein